MDQAEYLRLKRQQESPFAALYEAARQRDAGLAAEGRRPLLGGLLSKEPVAGVDTIEYEGIKSMLLGLLSPAANAIDAPMAAYQGNIPMEDMTGEATNLAGMLMGGGLASSGRGLLDYDPNVVSANKADLDPFKYQNVKMDNYLSDTNVGIRDAGENLERTPMSWEAMENKVVLPFYGDRTSGGKYIDSINDVRFDDPVYTEGGVDFLRGKANQRDDAVWASNSNITKRLSDTADAAALKFPDTDIVGLTGSMSPNANDFATMTGEAAGKYIQATGVPRATAAKFDEIMRSADPEFVGVNSPDLSNYLAGTTSPLRKIFMRLADTAPMKDGGLPDMGLARYAVTDVTQREMPPGMFGLGAARIDTTTPRMFNEPKGNRPVANVPHSTYNSQIAGEYMGSLPPVPQGLLFKDVYDSMEGQVTKNGQPLTSAHKTHAIKTKVPAQRITPEILGGILDYLSRPQG
jgi:hypothetical protein